jgi:hypothetical protein
MPCLSRARARRVGRGQLSGRQGHCRHLCWPCCGGIGRGQRPRRWRRLRLRWTRYYGRVQQHYLSGSRHYPGILRAREHWFPRSQLKLASTCLMYLSFNTFRSGSCPDDEEFESRLKQNVFLDYASRYWARHVRTVQEQVSELSSVFLNDAKLVSCAVQATSAPPREYWNYSQDFPEQSTGLHLTTVFGLLYLLEMLLAQSGADGGISADSKDANGCESISFVDGPTNYGPSSSCN